MPQIQAPWWHTNDTICLKLFTVNQNYHKTFPQVNGKTTPYEKFWRIEIAPRMSKPCKITSTCGPWDVMFLELQGHIGDHNKLQPLYLRNKIHYIHSIRFQ